MGTCLTVLGIFFNILKSVVLKTDFPYQLIPCINILLVGLFVGVAEESIFRGLIFGGLVPALVRSIKDIAPGEAVPFDADFLPRKVEFDWRKKKTKKEHDEK